MEKKRVEKLAKRLEGRLVDYQDKTFRKWIAEILKVEESLIDIDTNEIDLM